MLLGGMRTSKTSKKTVEVAIIIIRERMFMQMHVFCEAINHNLGAVNNRNFNYASNKPNMQTYFRQRRESILNAYFPFQKICGMVNGKGTRQIRY